MGIRKKQLSNSLVKWIETEVGMGPGVGDIFYLCSATTNADYLWLRSQGVDSDHLKTTWATAYAALTANRNDVLVVLPGGAISTTAALTWEKSYTHLIGATAPTYVNQRSRIYTTGTAVSPLMTWSGNGCVVKNIMFDHQGTHASTAGVCFNLSGARNYFEKVTFRHIGALAVASDTYRCLQLASANGENTFYKCTIGADTVDGGTGAGMILEFNGTNESARNVWEECLFLGNGSANTVFIGASTTSCLSSVNVFKRNVFYNNDNGTLDPMTQFTDLTINSGGQLLMMDNIIYGCATLQTTNSANLVGRNAYAAATTDTAVAITF